MNLRRAALAFTAALAAGAVTGCAGKRISDLERPPTPVPSGLVWTVPPGVDVPASERGAADVGGLYPSFVPGDRRCCWLGTEATIGLRPPPGTRIATIAVLVPDYPLFEAAPQTLTIVEGPVARVFTGLEPGVHRIDVPIAATAGAARLRFRCARAFVPARQHVNGDERSLGIILLGIRFR